MFKAINGRSIKKKETISRFFLKKTKTCERNKQKNAFENMKKARQ